MLRGCSVDTSRGEKCAGRAPRVYDCGNQHLSKPVLPTFCGVGAVEPRPTAWGEASPTTQPRQVRTARRAYSVGDRPTTYGAKRARTARHCVWSRLPRFAEGCAADLLRCWCGRAPADGVGRSAPCVGPQHNHAKSALRGERAAWVVSQYYAGRKARGPRPKGFEYGGHETLYLVPPTYRGVGAIEPRPAA